MNILIADDHALIRDGLKPFLHQVAGDVTIHEAAGLEEAQEIAVRQALDLMLLDLRMPGMNGAESLHQICAAYPQTRVVVLSGTVNGRVVGEALRAGAAGYLPKALHGETMMHALRLIISGGTYFPSAALASGCDDDSDGRAAEARADGPPVQGGRAADLDPRFAGLTPREREILTLLAQGRANKDIARELALTEITIKSHLRSVYRKIGVTNRTQATAAAYRGGLV